MRVMGQLVANEESTRFARRETTLEFHSLKEESESRFSARDSQVIDNRAPEQLIVSVILSSITGR